MTETTDGAGPEAIAIIGMAGRFPAACDIEALWRLLETGGTAMKPVPADVLARSIHARIHDRPGYVPMMSGLDDPDCFDAGFFRMPPRDAAFMDPQQRLLLETAWAAFEDAAIIPGDRDGIRTGVFASVNISGYLIANVMPRVHDGSIDPVEVVIANDKDYAATRIAYEFGLNGPAITVQTACSSSLVATHLACQSLLSRDCDRALVGACTVLIPNRLGYLYTEGGIRSPDGLCRPFDAAGDGTIFASGVAAVMLRRLDDALAAGDRIIAVIRGSAVNNDGATRVGFAAPGVDGQAAVIAEALAVAGVDPTAIGYVEAHGTATRLGDPIEIAALDQAWRAAAADPRALVPGLVPVGALKGNLGHMDTVAGLAGLIKTALVLDRGLIPATPHTNRPNPALDLDRRPFRLVPQPIPWPRGRMPRRAAVSSFGVGGTNAHVVLEEAPLPAGRPAASPVQLLAVSGADARAADAAVARLGAWLADRPDLPLADAAWTLRHGRKTFRHRRAVVAHDRATAAEALAAGRVIAGTATGTPVALILPGQGSQYPGLMRGLLATDPQAARIFRPLAEAVRAAGGPDLARLIAEGDAAVLADTRNTQPLLVAVELTLARLLDARGLRPERLAGHSIGELAAAALAGIFTDADACRLAVVRGRAMAATPEGAMLHLAASDARVQALIDGVRRPLGPAAVLEIAVINAPDAVVAGGSPAAIAALDEAARAAGIDTTRLRTSRAFHTALMAPALDVMAAAVAATPRQAPLRVLISSVDGRPLTAADATDPGWWAGQIRRPVRFAAALAALGDACLLVETGPPSGVAAFAAAAGLAPVVTLLPPARAAAGDPLVDRTALLSAAARLWVAGHDIALDPAEDAAGPRPVSLPGYPFARTRHWLPTPEDAAIAALDAGGSAAAPAAAEAAAPAADPAAIPAQPRPDLASAWAAPEGPVETALAAIWSELLYIAPIGRDDDFVELGGNSIMVLRMVRLAAEAGLALTAKSVFEARTVAGLARVVQPIGDPDETPADGPVTATPGLAAWAAEAAPATLHLRRLDLARPVDRATAAQAMTALARHHPMLRLTRPGGRPVIAADPPPAARLLAGPLADDAATVADALRAAGGPVCLALTDRPDRLWLAVDAAIADAASADLLATGLDRLLDRPDATLPPAGPGFPAWAAAAMPAARQDAALRAALDRLAAAAGPARPAAAGPQAMADLALDADISASLAGPAAQAYRTTTEELVWAAAASVLAGDLLWVASSGREAGFDLSRAVGPFAASVAVAVPAGIAAGPDNAIPAAKEALRTARARLGAMDLLDDLPPRLSPGGRQSDPRLSYLGPLDTAPPGRIVTATAADLVRAPGAPGGHALELLAWFAGGRLHLRLAATDRDAAALTALGRQILDRLAGLVAHCLDPAAGRLTPSDFASAGLDQSGLDDLLASLAE
ncbi:beta-ketoacyl synthase N-terminal-like domain-containing protein (plasmid) [Tistrella mobilis]|uniref:type I polyketide synthase n=1 Tax=Tistrella mobilis TaxID=171437 RepID=UPI003558A871